MVRKTRIFQSDNRGTTPTRATHSDGRRAGLIRVRRPEGKPRTCRGVWLTPHQFSLGDDHVAGGAHEGMPSRLSTLAHSSSKTTTTANIDSKDDPVPVLQSLDRDSNIVLIGSTNKLLFPSLRIGYGHPAARAGGRFLGVALLARISDNPACDQLVLCDFYC